MTSPPLFASVIQLSVVPVASLVAVVGDELSCTGWYTACGEYKELAQARDATVAITNWVNPGKVNRQLHH